MNLFLPLTNAAAWFSDRTGSSPSIRVHALLFSERSTEGVETSPRLSGRHLGRSVLLPPAFITALFPSSQPAIEPECPSVFYTAGESSRNQFGGSIPHQGLVLRGQRELEGRRPRQAILG